MKKQIAQGDVYFVKVDDQELENPEKANEFTFALGEATGHRHRVITKEPEQLVEIKQIADGQWLMNVKEVETKIVHEQHAPAGVELDTGTWRVIRQREFDPQRERLVAD